MQAIVEISKESAPSLSCWSAGQPVRPLQVARCMKRQAAVEACKRAAIGGEDAIHLIVFGFPDLRYWWSFVSNAMDKRSCMAYSGTSSFDPVHLGL